VKVDNASATTEVSYLMLTGDGSITLADTPTATLEMRGTRVSALMTRHALRNVLLMELTKTLGKELMAFRPTATL